MKRRSPAAVRQLVDKATRTNQQRDESEIAAGFASPAAGDDAGLLRTAMIALVCAMETTDWNAVAEAYVMLRQLHHRAYKSYYNPLP